MVFPNHMEKKINFTWRWSFNLPGRARNTCEWWHNVLDWSWHQPFVFQRYTWGVITNKRSSFDPVKNRTYEWASFSRPSRAGAMCNFNCAIGSYDHSWFEKRLASSIAMPHFTQNNNPSLPHKLTQYSFHCVSSIPTHWRSTCNFGGSWSSPNVTVLVVCNKYTTMSA